MEHIGIDVHKNQSQICILTSDGELIEKRIVTERGRFAAVFGCRPRAKILIEASTESAWVARCLEDLGHEVIVADPNYLPMYGHRTRRVKTDRRDARALAEACRNGTFRLAHRTSDERRHLRGRLDTREALVRTRARRFVVAALELAARSRKHALGLVMLSSEHVQERLDFSVAVPDLPLDRVVQFEVLPQGKQMFGAIVAGQ